MFQKKSKEKITKMDVLITSIVLGSIVAGAFGLRKKSEKDYPWWKKFLRRLIGK
ncbi:hypothetical protein KA050_01610 [Candidatus Gracilibacteria bacterium]|nr:hypothetical protein [Candidatus Gracilibacteria bacterium]